MSSLQQITTRVREIQAKYDAREKILRDNEILLKNALQERTDELHNLKTQFREVQSDLRMKNEICTGQKEQIDKISNASLVGVNITTEALLNAKRLGVIK